MYLVALIDDATSTLFARFVPADSTEHHMRVLWGYLERYGRPQAVYTDKASLFQPTLAPGWQNEEPGPKNETQLGRALRELGIEWIAAHSPQAKGRIERSFSTLQDRLVKGLRMAGTATIEDANRYLDEVFLPEWNERFTVEAESAIDAHRPMGDCLCLESILSHVETRQVQNDYTIAWAGKHWQIPRAGLRPGLRGSTIRVEARLAGTLQARIGDGFVQLRECERPARTAQKPKHRSKRYVPGAGESQWMNGFSIKRRQAFDETATSVPQANETACGSEESSPLFPFPQGKAGAGGFPPRRTKRGSPHKRAAAPLWIPCEHLDDAQQRLGTFYFVGIRNFLFCVDKAKSAARNLTRHAILKRVLRNGAVLALFCRTARRLGFVWSRIKPACLSRRSVVRVARPGPAPRLALFCRPARRLGFVWSRIKPACLSRRSVLGAARSGPAPR